MEGVVLCQENSIYEIQMDSNLFLMRLCKYEQKRLWFIVD